MRHDMPHVICERPRFGGQTPKGWNKNVPKEDLPSKESMRERYSKAGERKFFNEHLAPLRRFLLKKVGTPWDAVYSEICSNIKLTSTVQRHILEHVGWYVEKNCFMGDDGKVYKHWKFGRDCVSEETYHTYARMPTLYVHPETGILCKATIIKHARRPHAKVWHKASELLRYNKVDGIWYATHLRPIPKDVHAFVAWAHDYYRIRAEGQAMQRLLENPDAAIKSMVKKKRTVSTEPRVKFFPSDLIRGSLRYMSPRELNALRGDYGGDYYAAWRKQANRKELQRHGLKNDPV